MKRFRIQFAAIAAVIGVLCLSTYAGRQGTAAPGRPAALPTKIAFVDLEHVLQNYKKLDDLRQPLKEAFSEADAKARAIVEQANKITEEMKSSEIETGSPEYVELESKYISLSTRFEAHKASSKKTLERKDAQIIRTVYLEITQMLKEFAETNGYTLIMQFSRDAMTTQDLNKTKQKLSSSVVCNSGADDITDLVLAELTARYADGKKATPKATEAKATPPAKAPARKPAAAAAPPAKTTR